MKLSQNNIIMWCGTWLMYFTGATGVSMLRLVKYMRLKKYLTQISYSHASILTLMIIQSQTIILVFRQLHKPGLVIFEI